MTNQKEQPLKRVEISSPTKSKASMFAIILEGIYSIGGMLSGLFLIVCGILIFLFKDNIIADPTLDATFLKIRALWLPASLFFVILGIVVIYLTRPWIKIGSK
jgi:hypothetical protein